MAGLGQHGEFLHRGDHDADEEVENRQGSDHDAGHEEGPRMDFHDGAETGDDSDDAEGQQER